MKREGRQHGMVRTYRILPDALINHTPRFVNQIHTQPTAGMFAKVSTKPTNHSKSTGLSNSNRTKRRNNYKGNAIFSDGVRLSGVSASEVLSGFEQHEDEYEDQEIYGEVEEQYEVHGYELKDEKEERCNEECGDEIVIDEDGGAVTIGEMVILLENITEEDWCFVGADEPGSSSSSASCLQYD